MDIKTLETETYVPKFNGNRDLPAGDQVAVELYYPSIEENEPVADNPIGIIRLAVKGVRNLSQNGKAVETGEQLVKCRRGKLSDLVNELFIQIVTRNRLLGEPEKNSDGQSSSS